MEKWNDNSVPYPSLSWITGFSNCWKWLDNLVKGHKLHCQYPKTWWKWSHSSILIHMGFETQCVFEWSGHLFKILVVANIALYHLLRSAILWKMWSVKAKAIPFLAFSVVQKHWNYLTNWDGGVKNGILYNWTYFLIWVSVWSELVFISGKGNGIMFQLKKSSFCANTLS